ncbi:hypothetical protein EYC80_000189 [Monilinia laxa]|uniref:Cell wall mannoprotein PIR1-like C-terminal domain-containing protein n=1 Tax=Monilinia laxa TaxID=61186 RepID=A0A5N6K9T1_MONLA|nr:hypothetical protein EYC80_000189 [Monilinia laxa]
MKTTFAVLAGLTSVASAQVTALITPNASAPLGCATSYPDSFSISAVNVSSLAKRSDLAITLNGGVLKDQQDRTGYIASNYQFQFDGPPQTGAIYTGGWSVCSNGSLALGGSAVFYQCLSGNFYNLYTESQGQQCSQILIQTSAHGSAAETGAAGQYHDATATATAANSAAHISQISDGQLQGATSTPAPDSPISQISDGQIQGATYTASISQATPAATLATSTSSLASAVISQIGDGQIQASTATSIIHGSPTNGTYATATAPPSEYTGAASTIQMGGSLAAVAVCLFAAVL